MTLDASVMNGTAPVACVMDADGIASGQAFLVSELEKRDTLIRTPLNSFTYGRDLPIRVGGGWDEFVSAVSVGYGVTGGSGDGLVHAPGANGIPMVQANFDKGTFKAHVVSAGTRVMWVDMQRGNITGRNLDTVLRDGLRLAYDKHLDQNAYVGFTAYGTTGLINNSGVTATQAALNAGGTSRAFEDKTADEILADINTAILDAWEAAEYDLDAVPNHIIMPYAQYNYLATTKVSNLAEKTILTFEKVDGKWLVTNLEENRPGAAAGSTEEAATAATTSTEYAAETEFAAEGSTSSEYAEEAATDGEYSE
jgi:hypothetical protein